NIRGNKKIKTFTVGFDTTTEAKEARDTSDFLGTDHKEIKVSADTYWKTLPKAVFHFDEPVADPSAIGIYFLAKAAKEDVKVVLSGEGSDELFGGYNIYLEPFARRKIAWIPRAILGKIATSPGNFRGKAYALRAIRKLEEWYIGNASIFKPEEVKQLWKTAPGKAHSLHPLYEQVSGLNDSAKMQYIDIQTWLVGDILAKADKMTMAHSLELRVPFLDIKVAGLAATLPDKFKWKNGTTKYLLREAFKKVIPEKARKRKKLGFPTPIAEWLGKDRKDLYLTILKNPYIVEKMNTAYIEKLINDHAEKRADNARKIYLLLMLALWYNIFIIKSRD
ncbi:MAG: asparagine synthase C-terminal domain-containing protein, partial [Parcubacteria group bacterium]